MQSEQINELAGALSEAQGEFEPVPRTGFNPHYKTNYATLDDVIGGVRNVLAKHGLSYTQMLDGKDGVPYLTTTLYHASGQWIQSSVPFPSDISGGRNALQSFGRDLTYLRRYALSAMLGIASEEDNDGEGGNSNTRQRNSKKRTLSPQQRDDDSVTVPKTCFDVKTPKTGRRLGDLEIDELDALIEWGKSHAGELNDSQERLYNCAIAVKRGREDHRNADESETDGSFIATQWIYDETKSGKPYIGLIPDGMKWPDAKWWQGREEFLTAAEIDGMDAESIEIGQRFDCKLRVYYEMSGQWKNAVGFENLS